MFRSTFVHRTQHFRFKRGYANRRINFTFLFGEDLGALAPSQADADGGLPSESQLKQRAQSGHFPILMTLGGALLGGLPLRSERTPMRP